MVEKKPKEKSISKLVGGLASVGISSGLMLAALGGMNKMFGMEGEKSPQKLAEEMMAGAVRGILDHFEWKLDEQKRVIEKLQNDLTLAESKIENYEIALKDRDKKKKN